MAKSEVLTALPQDGRTSDTRRLPGERRPRAGLRTRLWASSRWAIAVVGAATFLGTVGFVGLPLASPGAFRSAIPYFLLGLPYWYLWAALVPVIVAVSRRYRIEADHWLTGVIAHSTSGIVLSLIQLAGYSSFAHLSGLFTTKTPWERYVDAVISWFHITFLVYWAIVAIVHAVLYYRDSKARAVAAAQLETQLAEARLKQLQMQLHPHFLFNTLHAVSGFVRDHRPKEATDMIAELASLLRLSLDRTVSATAPLEEELEFVKRYLRVEKARLGKRLEIQIDVPTDTLQARIPTMLLQALVENGVRHGIAPRVEKGCIALSAARRGQMLELTVRDDGPGFSESDILGESSGVGIGNTSERLERLYGSNQSLRLSNRERGGAVVVVTVPWHTEIEHDE